jgi:hypothetical protein
MNDSDDAGREAIAEQWWVGIAIWIGVVLVYFVATTCKLP